MRKFLFALLLLLAACSPQVDVSQNGIEVMQARVLVPPAGADKPGASAAAYMLIKNSASSPDRLVSVSAGFGQASLHESKTVAGVATMQAISGIDLPAGALVELRPGSYHVMIMDLDPGLKPGDTVQLTLHFKGAGPVTLSLKASGY